MKWLFAASLLWLGSLMHPSVSAADEPAQTSADPAPPSNHRLLLSASGSSLSEGGDGGGGGAVNWLHDVRPGTLIGAGIEYQSIADSHWTFGSLRGSLSRDGRSSGRSTFYAEMHLGSGRTALDSFDYSIAVAGISHTLASGLTLQLEDRQIEIDTTHGNLPKFGIAYLWKASWLAGVSYSKSISGNLGTELVAVRVDRFGRRVKLLAGGAYGDAAPAVFNLQTGVVVPERKLKQGFVGIAVPRPHSEFMLVADYLDVSGIKRKTLTLNCTIPLRARNSR